MRTSLDTYTKVYEGGGAATTTVFSMVGCLGKGVVRGFETRSNAANRCRTSLDNNNTLTGQVEYNDNGYMRRAVVSM